LIQPGGRGADSDRDGSARRLGDQQAGGDVQQQLVGHALGAEHLHDNAWAFLLQEAQYDDSYYTALPFDGIRRWNRASGADHHG
jgi:hypothetical protein